MRRYLLIPCVLLAFGSGSFAQTITANWSSPQQTIDGFGAASFGYEGTISSSLMSFFYTSSGIRLDIMRMQMFPDVPSCEYVQGTGNCTSLPGGAGAAALSDIANAKVAVADGALIFASEWSPPPSMKDSGVLDGGNFIGTAANYTALAADQAGYVALLAANGIPVYAISPQNEPDQNPGGYPGCIWTAQQFHDYIPYLHSALITVGYPNVKIMIAEQSTWSITDTTTAMGDSSVAGDVGVIAAHGYNVPQPTAPFSWNNNTGQHVWETEVSDFNAYDGTITSALNYAAQVHYYLSAAQVNAWNYWVLDGKFFGFTDNEALTDNNENIAKRAYAIGNWSRFVNPGWSEVSVTNSTSLLVTAFKNPSGTAGTIVAVNTTSNPITATFSVGTVMGTSVTPWLTSSSANLATQPAISVSSGSFSATVAADSIETFSSTDMQPAPPTGLTATVQ